jgi:hypothetical protein
MESKLFRSISEPIRTGLTWEQRWRGEDKGMIWNWERGRELRAENEELAHRADAGELVRLAWKGGTEKQKNTSTGSTIHGSLQYLAQRQGLRGQDLNIDISAEVTITCSKRRRKVVFREWPD